MEIIFIRHAEAEEKREKLEDLERPLMAKGKEAFRKLMPKFQERMEPLANRKFILWSSPAVRALETAHIAAQTLQIDEYSIQDFIYEGGFEKLLSEVKKVDDQTTLLIVGHEPMLSEWTSELTGQDVKIKKGEILNLKVSKRSPLEAELQWTITPE